MLRAAHGIRLHPFPNIRVRLFFRFPGLLLRFWFTPYRGVLIRTGSPACFRFTPTLRLTFPFPARSRGSCIRAPDRCVTDGRRPVILMGNFPPGARLFPIPSPFIPIRQ